MKRALLLAVLFSSAPVVALADAIPPPIAMTCPDGARASSSHAGMRCVAGPACVADTSCGGGTCRPAALCLTQIPCGGLATEDCRMTVVASACDAAGGCAAGTCDTTSRCTEPAPPATAPPPGTSSSGTTEAPASTWTCAATSRRVGHGVCSLAPVLFIVSSVLVWAGRRPWRPS